MVKRLSLPSEFIGENICTQGTKQGSCNHQGDGERPECLELAVVNEHVEFSSRVQLFAPFIITCPMFSFHFLSTSSAFDFSHPQTYDLLIKKLSALQSMIDENTTQVRRKPEYYWRTVCGAFITPI